MLAPGLPYGQGASAARDSVFQFFTVPHAHSSHRSLTPQLRASSFSFSALYPLSNALPTNPPKSLPPSSSFPYAQGLGGKEEGYWSEERSIIGLAERGCGTHDPIAPGCPTPCTRSLPKWQAWGRRALHFHSTSWPAPPAPAFPVPAWQHPVPRPHPC